MARTLKFRAWSAASNCFVAPSVLRGVVPMEVVARDPGEIIEQFTGLIDKNGKDIFEGDIIMDPSWWWGPGEVFLNVGQCGPCTGESVMSYICRNERNTHHNIWDGKDVEVIGNIHETPTLLKEESKT